MAGRPSAALVEAIRLVHLYKVTPLQAAKRMQIQPSTMYKSRLYKLWRTGTPASLAELALELDPHRARPPAKKKSLQPEITSA